MGYKIVIKITKFYQYNLLKGDNLNTKHKRAIILHETHNLDLLYNHTKYTHVQRKVTSYRNAYNFLTT